MFRKILITAIVVTAVFAAGSGVYAQAGDEMRGKDTTPIFELLSDKEESKTFEWEYVVSAISKEGTAVEVNVYWFSLEDEKSILAKKKAVDSSEKEGTWILQQTEEYTVGNSNIFAESVALNIGKNRIVLNIKDKVGNTDERTLEIERFLKKEVNKEVSGNAIDEMNDRIYGTNKPQ